MTTTPQREPSYQDLLAAYESMEMIGRFFTSGGIDGLDIASEVAGVLISTGRYVSNVDSTGEGTDPWLVEV